MSEAPGGKLTIADVQGLLDHIRTHARTQEPKVHLALYAVPCPVCHHEAAVQLPKGYCCERCATIHNGERVILKPTHNRKGPSWSFTLDIRDNIRNHRGRRLDVVPAPPITIGEMWRNLKRDEL